GFRGALVTVALDLVLFLRRWFLADGEVGGLPGAVGGGPADVADALRRLDVAERAVNRLVPDFAGLWFAEPLHRAPLHPSMVDWGQRKCKRDHRGAWISDRSARALGADAFELRLLVVAERAKELLQRGPHLLDRIQHGVEPGIRCRQPVR